MNERIISILTKVKETVKNLSTKTKKIIILGVTFSIILSVGVAVWLNNRPYVTLFSGLSTEEASEIMGKLQEDGVAYKYESLSSGSTILVEESQAEQLKAELVYEGYPKSGFTYDAFTENVSLTSSESEKQYYERLGLQDRMGATISTFFPNIKEAKVTIAFGEDKKYVLDSGNASKATASVAVTTKDGSNITEDDVRAMQRLVSRSIPELEFESVAVICNGKDVSTTEEQSGTNANQLKLEVEEAIDLKIKNKILDILIPIYGEEHVEVSVKSEVDINKKLRELTNYTAENEDTNTGVKSSETAHQEVGKDGETTGGVPGTETNSDIPVYSAITQDGSENYIVSDGTAEYLVDQIKEQEQVDAGDVEDLTIAVIIDDDNLDEGVRADLISLVAKSAGISTEDSEEKIELVGISFMKDDAQAETVESNVPDKEQIKRLGIIGGIAIGALIIIIIIILIIVKIIKKRRNKRNKNIIIQQEPIVYNEPTSEQNLDAVSDLINIKNEKSMELKNRIREITEESPEISAQTLKSWLRGGEKDGK